MARKQARKQARSEAVDDGVDAEPDDVAAAPPITLPQEEVLSRLAELHQRFEDGDVDFDTFEETKADLIGQLDV